MKTSFVGRLVGASMIVVCGWMGASGVDASVIPDAVNYQGVLVRTMSGEVVTNAQDVTIRIYDQATGGRLLWGETRSVYPKATDPQQGLFSVTLGEGTPLSGAQYTSLQDVFAPGDNQASRYIEFQLADEAAPIAPRQQFLPVPYAFTAADATGVNADFLVSGTLTVSSSSLGTATLTVNNNLDVAEYLTLSGPTTLSGGATISGSATFNYPVSFSGNADFKNTATVAGKAQFGDLAEFQGGVSWGTLSAESSSNRTVKIGTTNTAASDGFVVVQFATNGNDSDSKGHVEVVVAGKTLKMRQYGHASGAGDTHFSDVATVPVAYGESYCVKKVDKLDDSTLSAEFIPLGKEP